jgi:DNA-binding transcriptional ArsR family regulator
LLIDASIVFLQLESRDGRVALKIDGGFASLQIEGAQILQLPVTEERTLTRQRAAELAALGEEHGLVLFERSSPAARELLREAGVPFASTGGEVFLHAPPVHIEWPGRLKTKWPAGPAIPSPFAIRASRVPRWLLLNVGEELSFRELSAQIKLSESMVSRTVRTLADDGLVEVSFDPADARRRLVRLRKPGPLLDAFERADATRRYRQRTWEVGARDVEGALDRLERTAKRQRLSYALGGLAGASLILRAVEPATVDAWIDREDSELWIDALGATPARPGPGRVNLRLMPDPFVLDLAARIGRARVADRVQLYLDCRRAGERAIDAAEAIRSEMRW